MISSRFMPLTCLIVGLALVPTLIHSYVGATVADGLATADIPESLSGFTARPSDRDATWGKRRFDSDDWIERRYTSSGDEVVLTVVRSYDLKKLYHHPELAVAYGTPFVEHDTVRFARNPSIPVHVLRTGRGSSALAVYVLHYDGRFVENPISFQIRTAGELLFTGRKPMTLFFARDPAIVEGADPQGTAAAALLFSAIDRFIAQSGAESR
jgi:hypothetical protein